MTEHVWEPRMIIAIPIRQAQSMSAHGARHIAGTDSDVGTTERFAVSPFENGRQPPGGGARIGGIEATG